MSKYIDVFVSFRKVMVPDVLNGLICPSINICQAGDADCLTIFICKTYFTEYRSSGTVFKITWEKKLKFNVVLLE